MVGEKKVNPAFLALSRFRRRKYKECVELCTELLADNPYDKAIWLLKCQALTAMTYIDDSDLEEQGLADAIMDENGTAAIPRPGTSIHSSQGSRSLDPALRPTSQSGRPTSGFVRPSTQSSYRPGTKESSRSAVETAMRKTGRPGTSRPVTALGRHVRLGTASMRSEAEGPFIDVNRMDLKRYAKRPSLARALEDFLLYHDHNPRKALELAAEATKVNDFECWWWKQRLGKCFYLLGLYRDAEQQFKSSLRTHRCIDTVLDLGKVYLRLDQPQNALDTYTAAMEWFPESTAVMIAIARTHEMLFNTDMALDFYKKVLKLDPGNIEATANLGAHYFYADQPEVAIRFYRRLLESTRTGAENLASAELWNNLGLCCFYASQYDMTLRCFENALQTADDSTISDVWYNIGHVGIGVGDLGLAYQCFKVAVSLNPSNGEAWNNLGILELRKGNSNDAASDLSQACEHASYSFEPFFNAALLAYKRGDFLNSYNMANRSKTLYNTHPDTDELLAVLQRRLM